MSGIGQEFIEKTKYTHLRQSDQMRGVSQPPLGWPSDAGQLHELPDPNGVERNPVSLFEAIGRRRSIRSYKDESINLEELSYLLWCTQGVQKIMPGHATLRTVPSAGARHALETYLLVNHVDSLSPGLYRFLALSHQLSEVEKGTDIDNQITKACLDQSFVKNCAVVFIWTAIPYRMSWRYSERGYRYLFLDAGHACQNLYLSSESIDCGVCAIAAFSDDDMNRCLKLDGKEHFVIYLATVGKK